MECLACRCGLSAQGAEMPPVPAEDIGEELVSNWIASVALALRLDVEPAQSSYADVKHLVRSCAPAILQVGSGARSRFLAVVSGGARHVELLGPDLRICHVEVDAIRLALCQSTEAPLLKETASLLEEVRVPLRRRPRAQAAILRQRLAGARLTFCWLLRLPATATLWTQFKHAQLPSRMLGLLAAHAAQYLLWLLSWWMIGSAALQGSFDRGWMVAWALLLFAMVPFRALETWWQGGVSIRAGALLKQRLLLGVLQLQPEEIRRQGAGQLLGRIIESEAVESLALSGGFLALLAGLELVLAAIVMAKGVGGWLHVGLLAAWVCITALLAWRYFQKRGNWTAARLDMTHDLVESMAGHRTRLVQSDRKHWHNEEDRAVSRTLALAVEMDQLAIHLTALARSQGEDEPDPACLANPWAARVDPLFRFPRKLARLSCCQPWRCCVGVPRLSAAGHGDDPHRRSVHFLETNRLIVPGCSQVRKRSSRRTCNDAYNWSRSADEI